MSTWGWVVVGLLAAWVCLCHINVLVLRRWVVRLNATVTADRTAALKSQGRCGQPSPGLLPGVAPLHCELSFGHGGWHKSGDGHTGVATEWSR